LRAVLDPNILIAAVLSPGGPPSEIISRWLGGEFELVVSELLLAELERALAYPKLHAHITSGQAAEFVRLLAHGGMRAPDPSAPPRRSMDPGDDYLLALAEQENAVLVSGDRHLLQLAGEFPVRTARAFLEAMDTGLGRP
jgi:uncharacterized protein